MTFANPEFLFLLLLLVPVVVWYILKNKSSQASLQISSINGFKGSNPSLKYYMRHVLFAFRVIAIALLFMALARPQASENWKDVTTEGIDIVIALDISSSMLARDFNPNRMEASKEIAKEFIQGRPNDRIGLVVFSGESFTQCPLTTDHTVLMNLFEDIESGMVEDGTAIGMGLATAVNRMKESETESKVVILLTDGVNNMGSIAPATAAEIAKTFDIRVYTIGVGSHGEAPYPVNTPYGVRYKDMKVEIDEDVLLQIASETEGEYFRATNNQKLKSIYQQIDEMEKSEIEVKEFSEKSEEYLGFALIAGILLLIEIVSKSTLMRSIP
ncbi:MAG: VWA domain-containing protein [Bacteroidales bacterium]|nr:VWA domain-containing protein [Bacteroidales bacterium]MBS3776261.1 VWA domain-containing protein [Bacteroidales bacterium]